MSEPVQKTGMALKWQWLVIAIVALIFFVLSSHWWLLYGRSVRGTVVNAANSQTLPDATVVVKWIGSLSGVHGPSYPCYHVALATTGKEGGFYIPFWWQQTYTGASPSWLQGIWTMGMDKPVHFTAYKAGYFIVEPAYPVAAGEEIVIKMEPVKGTPIDRLSYLTSMFDREVMCDADDKTLIPVYQAAYDEGKSIASSPEEQEMANILLIGLEASQYGNSEALDRNGARRLKRLTEQQNELRK